MEARHSARLTRWSANVNSRLTMGYTAIGEAFRYGDTVFELNAEDLGVGGVGGDESGEG